MACLLLDPFLVQFVLVFHAVSHFGRIQQKRSTFQEKYLIPTYYHHFRPVLPSKPCFTRQYHTLPLTKYPPPRLSKKLPILIILSKHFQWNGCPLHFQKSTSASPAHPASPVSPASPPSQPSQPSAVSPASPAQPAQPSQPGSPVWCDSITHLMDFHSRSSVLHDSITLRPSESTPPTIEQKASNSNHPE